MAEKDLPTLSDVQHEVMNVVWDIGPCSSSDVWKTLNARRGLSRNTVHTQLVRLEEKGWLRRRSEDGNSTFEAVVTRESTQQDCVRRLIDTVFDGSAESLMLTLLHQGTVSAEEAERIRKTIAKAKRKSS